MISRFIIYSRSKNSFTGSAYQHLTKAEKKFKTISAEPLQVIILLLWTGKITKS
jgi:hypothetical protein